MIDMQQRWASDEAVAAMRKAQEGILRFNEHVNDLRGSDTDAVLHLRAAHGSIAAAISDQEIWAGPPEKEAADG